MNVLFFLILTGFDRVVKTTILLSNMDDYKVVNEEYAKGEYLHSWLTISDGNLFAKLPSNVV